MTAEFIFTAYSSNFFHSLGQIYIVLPSPTPVEPNLVAVSPYLPYRNTLLLDELPFLCLHLSFKGMLFQTNLSKPLNRLIT